MDNTDEYLDLVDENDLVIGREKRSEVHAKHLNNFRAVNAFIVNSSGELWIPRRTAHKQIAPLGLDMSMGGHVESGETYEQTFRREMAEELNIDTGVVPYKVIGYFKGGEHGLKAFQMIFELKMDTVPDYNPTDFFESFWFKPLDLLKRIEGGEKTKSDLPILVRLLYLNKNHH
ncbi:MAG: NUDIX domain-containing protein [Candidatus Pacebacteria bacterium]|nr:NUDIX domain-containing protein [Candidatus Paceibacterota bacterium]MBP9831980.1 NUDIX domain-containing protein [Candidatus Paceibacterota bacterium]